MALSTFGVGTPIAYSPQAVPGGLSPYPLQGLSINPYGLQPLQQALQLLQIVPQQLQHLQQLEYQQQQQLQQLQQIVQQIPVQLAQLQQLIQFVPPQIQQSQQMQQPFGQVPGVGGFAAAPPWAGTPPQTFGPPLGHVM